MTAPPPGVVPIPPDPFGPHFETLAAGTLVYRVHEPVFEDGHANDGTVFNPGFGQPMRWSFFGDPRVPVLYCAQTPRSAVYESVLHDAAPRSFVPTRHWSTKVLTVLRTRHDVRLAQSHSEGLRAMGIFPSNLTDTHSDQYPQTVPWAQAAHDAGADGVVWMSRQLNSARAYCLFGDRVPSQALEPVTGHDEARVFATPADGEWLAKVALEIGARVRMPTR